MTPGSVRKCQKKQKPQLFVKTIALTYQCWHARPFSHPTSSLLNLSAMPKSWTFLNVWEGRPRAHWGHRALVRTARCVLRRCKTNKHGMGYRLPDILWNWYCRRHAASPPERVVVECVFWCMLRFERPNKMQLKMPRRLVYPAAPSARAYPGHFWAGQLATGMPLWKVGNFDVSHGKYDTWIWLYTSNEACMRSLRHILRAWCRPAGYDSRRLTRFGVLKKILRGLLHCTQDLYHISELTKFKLYLRTICGAIMGTIERRHQSQIHTTVPVPNGPRIPN